MSKVSTSKKIPLLIRACQQQSVILTKTEMKKKLDTDDEGMISDYESEHEMSEEHVLKYLENGAVNAFFVCVELEDYASEKLSG